MVDSTDGMKVVEQRMGMGVINNLHVRRLPGCVSCTFSTLSRDVRSIRLHDSGIFAFTFHLLIDADKKEGGFGSPT